MPILDMGTGFGEAAGAAASQMTPVIARLQKREEEKRRWELEQARKEENDLYAKDNAERRHGQRLVEFYATERQRAIDNDRTRRLDRENNARFDQTEGRANKSLDANIENAEGRLDLQGRVLDQRAAESETADEHSNNILEMNRTRTDLAVQKSFGPTAPPISAASIYQLYAVGRKYDSAGADAFGTRWGDRMKDLDGNPALRIEAYKDAMQMVRTSEDNAIQRIQSESYENLQQDATEYFQEFKSNELITENLLDHLNKAENRIFATVDPNTGERMSPEDVSRASEIYANNFSIRANAERQRSEWMDEGKKILSDVSTYGLTDAQLTKAKAALGRLKRSDDIEADWDEFSAVVYPQQARQYSRGAAAQRDADAANEAGAGEEPTVKVRAAVGDNPPVEEKEQAESYAAWASGKGYRLPASPEVQAGWRAEYREYRSSFLKEEKVEAKEKKRKLKNAALMGPWG